MLFLSPHIIPVFTHPIGVLEIPPKSLGESAVFFASSILSEALGCTSQKQKAWRKRCNTLSALSQAKRNARLFLPRT